MNYNFNLKKKTGFFFFLATQKQKKIFFKNIFLLLYKSLTIAALLVSVNQKLWLLWSKSVYSLLIYSRREAETCLPFVSQ